MRYSRWLTLTLCCLIVCFAGGCASPEDTEPSSIEAMPYAVGVVSARLEDAANVLNELSEAGKADWLIREIQIEPEGRIHLGMEMHYCGTPPESLRFLGSAVLLELMAHYIYEPNGWIGRIASGSVPIWFKATSFSGSSSRQVGFRINGDFELPEAIRNPDVPLIELRWLKLAFVWIRLYEDTTGRYHYEWVVPTDCVSEPPETPRVGPTYRELAGSFGAIYHPLPEHETHPILETHVGTYYFSEDTPKFDYVHWMKEQLVEGDASGR